MQQPLTCSLRKKISKNVMTIGKNLPAVPGGGLKDGG
jgi:hypothetical protein